MLQHFYFGWSLDEILQGVQKFLENTKFSHGLEGFLLLSTTLALAV